MGEARLRGARVRLLLGWWYTDGYDDLVFPDPVADAESARRRAELLDQVAPLLEGGADPEPDVVVVHRRPADLLVGASGAAQLVVVGRHHPTRPWGSHLGPITRTVLKEAAAPVMVVDTVPQEQSLDRTRERARHRARHRAAAVGG
jgi:nucleotide-binding universal stress UspA family protein